MEVIRRVRAEAADFLGAYKCGAADRADLLIQLSALDRLLDESAHLNPTRRTTVEGGRQEHALRQAGKAAKSKQLQEARRRIDHRGNQIEGRRLDHRVHEAATQAQLLSTRIKQLKQRCTEGAGGWRGRSLMPVSFGASRDDASLAPQNTLSAGASNSPTFQLVPQSSGQRCAAVYARARNRSGAADISPIHNAGVRQFHCGHLCPSQPQYVPLIMDRLMLTPADDNLTTELRQICETVKASHQPELVFGRGNVGTVVEITDGLSLGSAEGIDDDAAFTHLVSCGPVLCSSVDLANTLVLNSRDDQLYDLIGYHADQVSTFIDDAMHTGGKVLIHCCRSTAFRANHSAALCTAYLMQRKQRDVASAVKHVCELQHPVFWHPRVGDPNSALLVQLIKLDHQLRAKRQRDDDVQVPIAAWLQSKYHASLPPPN